jgi:hypothetical protein
MDPQHCVTCTKKFEFKSLRLYNISNYWSLLLFSAIINNCDRFEELSQVGYRTFTSTAYRVLDESAIILELVDWVDLIPDSLLIILNPEPISLE